MKKTMEKVGLGICGFLLGWQLMGCTPDGVVPVDPYADCSPEDPAFCPCYAEEINAERALEAHYAWQNNYDTFLDWCQRAPEWLRPDDCWAEANNRFGDYTETQERVDLTRTALEVCQNNLAMGI